MGFIRFVLPVGRIKNRDLFCFAPLQRLDLVLILNGTEYMAISLKINQSKMLVNMWEPRSRA